MGAHPPQRPAVAREVPATRLPTDGIPDALDRLWVEMQAELRRVAHRQLGVERHGHTLSTTALIHEVYLKLAGQHSVRWEDRGQFFALASRAMRRILIDYARRHRHMRDRLRYDSLDAGDAGDADAPAPAVQLAGTQRADELIALDEALDALAQAAPRLAQVVECRFFAGYTEEETAEALGVTSRTVNRDWTKARAWLRVAMRDGAREAD